MKKKATPSNKAAPKKKSASADDELALQPVEPINDAVVTTHRGSNAREQIINQIHADGGGGAPDLPADAPEFEAPRRPPLFTAASIVRLVILLAILAGVAVFVFNVYKNVFGRPINPEAPPDRAKTVASMTQPPVRDFPVAAPAPATPTAPAPAPAAKNDDSAKAAKPAAPTVPAKSPYLNSGQDELLSAKDMADKQQETPAPPPPAPAQQLDINDMIGKPNDAGSSNDGGAGNAPVHAPQPSLPSPKPPPQEQAQVIPPAPDLAHPPTAKPAPSPAPAASAVAQKALEGPVTSTVPTVMPVPLHHKDDITILNDYPGWFCRDYSEDNSLQQGQSIHRDRSKVIALTPPPKRTAQLVALIEIPDKFDNAELVIDVSTRDIPHTWQVHALANNDEVLPATEVKTTKEKGWNEVHISLAKQKGTRFYLALEVLPAAGSTFWKENVGFISNMRLNWKK